MLFCKEIPVKYNVDIFVAGGGPSGFAAAVSAARQGKTVFLAENNGCFGGSGTTALVPCFAQFTDGKDFLVGGVGKEIRDMTIGSDCDYKRGFYPYPVEKLKRVYDRIALKEKNLSFSFFTRLIDVVAKNGRVENVVLAAKSGIFAVKAKIYIDCTGDGDLSAWAGADFEYGDDNGDAMPPTLCSLFSNIDFDKKDAALMNNENLFSNSIEQAIKDGVFSVEDRHVPGILEVSVLKGIGGGNLGHQFGTNGTDEVSLTTAMINGRKQVKEFERFYREYIPGHEDIFLCYTADMLGIRESRRIIGEYRLTGKDFLNRACFDDEIGRYAYPVDIHIMKPTKAAYDAYEKEYTKDMVYGVGESYGIPYRALIPKKLTNVLVAGRCLSADRQMQASIRVMPGCYITGQAAGIAASLAAESEEVRSVNKDKLKNAIISAGGIIKQ